MQIKASGACIGTAEKAALIEVAEEGWFTAGHRAHEFEGAFARHTGVAHAILTNSGSSANLLALTALTAPELPRHLKPGDEVITLAAGFPTTVNPILQLGLVPVFVDLRLDTLNVRIGSLEEAYTDKVKAIILPHTLGNPFDVAAVSHFAYSRGLWLIEDCCDALGAEYCGSQVGSFGDIGTFSFFPAHHITMGEGGCVVTASDRLAGIIRSLRDWGRDCHCDPGQDGVCGQRFTQQFGSLPEGYDHKYVFTHIGYNLRVTEMQAALGLAQLRKLESFVEARRKNFDALYEGTMGLPDLIPVETTQRAKPSWFGFPLLCAEGVERWRVTEYLEKHGISTRLLFGGNLTRQPAYRGLRWKAVELPFTEVVMKDMFWVGVWPGLTEEHIQYMLDTLWEGHKTSWT